MKLDFNAIKKLTLGAVSVEDRGENFVFHRFSREEEEYYKKTEFYPRTSATAGIELCFETDASAIALSGTVHQTSSRTYYAIDVISNGKHVGSIKNFREEEMVPSYVEKCLEQGDFSGTISLGDGKKTVRIVLPCLSSCYFREVDLLDATFFTPVRREKTMLIYGDSITQGFDALHPHRTYAIRLAHALNAEAYNKAIGGEFFRPELAKIKSAVCPDYVTVAYGTNDWANLSPKEVFESRAREFYQNLLENYPSAKIFAISPIWRKGCENFEDKICPFHEVAETINAIADSLPNVVHIAGFDLVPHDESYFGDLRLHPSCEGFDCYFNNLLKKIKEHI